MTTEILKWFCDELLPDLVKDGHFAENGETQTVSTCQFETIRKGIDSFASAPSFAILNLETDVGIISLDILIKFQSQDPIFRARMKTAPQFKNEITMYNVVLPEFADFLKHCNQKPDLIEDIVPKCYFARVNEDKPEKSILILEDLRKYGFRPSKSMVELDLIHCLVALGQLARFHAISFAMKRQNWKNFEKLKNLFVPVWFENDSQTRKDCEDFRGYCSQRGIDYLLWKKDSEVPKEYLQRFRCRLGPIFDLLLHLNAPTEPLSVICHGDFNRNNILFRYEAEEVTQAKLIDFQTFLYGSPCLDLSFFIYMNTTLEFRDKYFDEIFSHYYSTLTKTISDILEMKEEKIMDWIPFELFRDEFARVAIQAYVTVAFFLPMMMAPSGEHFDEDIIFKTNEQIATETYKRGGEEVSRRIAEVIVDFYRRKFYM